MELRNYCPNDAEAVDRVAVAAFEQFRDLYDDWPAMAASVGRMSELAKSAELIVAEHEDHVIGAVGYVGPGQTKAEWFDRAWPVIRLLVVDPAHRGLGVGRTLTEECVQRARRDRSPVIALHTSPIMTVALPMYRRMGFEWHCDTPPIRGVPYAVYLKRFDDA